jgi:hypothetical protein
VPPAFRQCGGEVRRDRDAKTTERYEHVVASYLTKRVDRHDDALWLPRPSRHEAPA